MKIRFDNNMSFRVARALKGFLSDRNQFEISHVADFDPPNADDPTWLQQFAADGGHAIVSGDANILQNWPDLVAYHQSGLISYWPPKKTDSWNGYAKAALWIRWWPTLNEHMKTAERGSMWRLPNSFEPSMNTLKRLEDPRTASDVARAKSRIEHLPRRSKFSGSDEPL